MHPDFGEFPARINSDHQFGQNLQNTLQPEFWRWVSFVDKVWSRPTWTELLWVAGDFDSPWITGSMTPHQSLVSVRYITLAPTANLCTPSSIVFVSINARIWHLLCWYCRWQRNFCWLSKYPYDPDDQRFHQASQWKLCGMKRSFDKIISVCDKLSISHLYISTMTSVAPYFRYDFTGVLPVDCIIKSGPRAKLYGFGKPKNSNISHTPGLAFSKTNFQNESLS